MKTSVILTFIFEKQKILLLWFSWRNKYICHGIHCSTIDCEYWHKKIKIKLLRVTRTLLLEEKKNLALKTTGTQTDEICITKSAFVKLECPIGFIVRINERNLDYSKWKNRYNAPTFFGYVEDLKDSESIVSFVMVGNYEWYNKTCPIYFRVTLKASSSPYAHTRRKV